MHRARNAAELGQGSAVILPPILASLEAGVCQRAGDPRATMSRRRLAPSIAALIDIDDRPSRRHFPSLPYFFFLFFGSLIMKPFAR